MPTAKQKFCERAGCEKSYFATRDDSKFCSRECRDKEKYENRKFKFAHTVKPTCAIPGINFNRAYQRWHVKIKIGKDWVHIGSTKTLDEAIALYKEKEEN